MINRTQLLADLQKLLQRLEADLLERSESTDVPEVGKTLRAEYDRAKKAERTAQNYEDWRTDAITQAAAAWVLSCVFVRFLEDNRLIDPPKMAGPTSLPLPQGEGRGEGRLQRARDEHELYFRSHPSQTDRDYLLAVFEQLAKLPGTKDVFGEHNPIRELPNWLSGDAAGELLRFFQKIDANTGALIHDFSDANWDTRFLGDLYQDLSEAARKKYALLQTPEFVEEFILDRTLDPALDEFGLEPHAKTQRHKDDQTTASSLSASAPSRETCFKMIDPACGSGHFLLGSFRRILDRWQRKEPGTNVRELVQRALDSIHGVDVNPFAIAIARFRLLLAAMRACGIERLADAPAFRLNLVCGDSLLHAPLAAGGRKYTAGQQELDFALAGDPEDSDECDHAYRSENLPELKRLLRGGQYHAVVANPPYITPKDRQLNERYRKRFTSCHMKYSLSVPFLERIFQLAVKGSRHSPSAVADQSDDAADGTRADGTRSVPATGAGYTGQITANSFMKREFGKKLIESFFPSVDLTHVIDTSGAYIPGHGTPTVILLGRHRPPVASTLRTVMGIRGEPATPDDPARGLVWSAIIEQIDQAGTQSEFVSVGDSLRALFHKHPWSIGGGGAAELKEKLEHSQSVVLSDVAASSGVMCVTGEDDAYVAEGAGYWRRNRVVPTDLREFGVGEDVRDWQLSARQAVLFPYDDKLAVKCLAESDRLLWPSRSTVAAGIYFGQTKTERGMDWREYAIVIKDRLRTPLSIVFGEVATHNHFVLDRGGKVFKQTAPVIKLPREATEDDHLALLGLLNSSTACFWMKQVAHNKGDSTDQHGARTIGDPAFNTYAYNGTLVGKFPLPLPDGHRSTDQRGAKAKGGAGDVEPRPFASGVLRLARQLDELAQQRQRSSPTSVLRASAPTRDSLSAARAASDQTLRQMIAAQEELDWECYRLYGLIEDDLTRRDATVREGEAPAEPLSATDVGQLIDGSAGASPSHVAPWREPPPLQLGQRAFEIVLARKMAQSSRHTPCAVRFGTRSVPATFQTTWFERHGSTPITELPAEWPDDYRQLVQRRIDLIESNPSIRLIEQPEYKRRWNTEPWDSQLERALREWLLNRLESYFDFDGRMRREGEAPAEPRSATDAGRAIDGSAGASPSRTSPPLADIALYSLARLADVARQDSEFQQVGELYRNDRAFDVLKLVEELVSAESVPQLPVLRYKDSGLRKRAEWEKTWELQREEDRLAARREASRLAIERERDRLIDQNLSDAKAALAAQSTTLWKNCLAVRDRFARSLKLPEDGNPDLAVELIGRHGVATEGGVALQELWDARERLSKARSQFESSVRELCRQDAGYQAAVQDHDSIPADPDIDVPPKYESKDFLASNLWRLRGKLDVPKERWISFPHCEGSDGTLVICWAGYDHLQQALAISACYVDIQERLGGRDDPRLIPLLASLIELLPWLKQWHNDPDPAFDGMRMGDYFEGFITEEARQLNKTIPEIKAWTPPARTSGRGRRPK